MTYSLEKLLSMGLCGMGIGILVGLNLNHYDWQWGIFILLLGVVGLFFPYKKKGENK